MLSYAATGRLPFGSVDSGAHALMFRIAQEEPDLEGVPEGIAELVRDCLRKDPGARPTLDRILERTGAEDTVSGGRSRDPWLPSALVAQLGRHAVRLLDTEDPVGPGSRRSRGSGGAGEARRCGRARASRPGGGWLRGADPRGLARARPGRRGDTAGPAPDRGRDPGRPAAGAGCPARRRLRRRRRPWRHPAHPAYGSPQQHPQQPAYGYPEPGPHSPHGSAPSYGATPSYGPNPPYGHGSSYGPTPPYDVPLPYLPTAPEEPRRSGRSTVALVLIALVVALAAGGSVYGLMNGGGEERTGGDPTVSPTVTTDTTGSGGDDPNAPTPSPSPTTSAPGTV
ncbi:hypothetical protein WKI71_24230 [Streptomyces sp. MS1.AVA.1]|uniref:Protein kinase domain-containing protein n=1 Tax=Streptomyces machairae TaxID=3134109 RepID=A0ABU8UQE7_9ACTN